VRRQFLGDALHHQPAVGRCCDYPEYDWAYGDQVCVCSPAMPVGLAAIRNAVGSVSLRDSCCHHHVCREYRDAPRSPNHDGDTGGGVGVGEILHSGIMRGRFGGGTCTIGCGRRGIPQRESRRTRRKRCTLPICSLGCPWHRIPRTSQQPGLPYPQLAADCRSLPVALYLVLSLTTGNGSRQARESTYGDRLDTWRSVRRALAISVRTHWLQVADRPKDTGPMA